MEFANAVKLENGKVSTDLGSASPEISQPRPQEYARWRGHTLKRIYNFFMCANIRFQLISGTGLASSIHLPQKVLLLVSVAYAEKDL